MDTCRVDAKAVTRIPDVFDIDDRDAGCPWAEDKYTLNVFDFRITTDADLAAHNRAPVQFHFHRNEGADLHIEMSGVSCKWFSVWRLASSTGFRAVANPDFLDEIAFVQMAAKGRIHVQGGADESVAEAGFGLIAAFRDMQHVDISPGYDSINCTLRLKPILHQLRQLDGGVASHSDDFQAVAELSTPALRSFRHNVHVLFDRLRKEGAQEGLADPLVEEILVAQLLGSWPRKPARNPAPRSASSRHVQRSLDFIEANLAAPISVADVATAAGIGVRALQSGFRKDLGRTPVQYVIDRRLDKVHEELLRGGSTSISGIATRWGFIHMSDFSRRYRQRFGCTPSETQIRAGRQH